MPHDFPSGPGPALAGGSVELAGYRPSDDIDPELLALPAPSRRERSFALVLLGAGVLAALAMAFVLRKDVSYAVAGGDVAADLGDLRIAPDATLAEHDNGFVRATGLLGAAGGIRYERPLRDDTYRALPVVGRTGGAAVWVEVRVPYGLETGRWEPPRSFVGHLVRFDSAGPRHNGLARAIREATTTQVPPGSFLVVDDEDPAHVRWPAFLALVFLGLAAANAAAIARLVRKVS
jgi:hypothetical protein